MHGSLILSGLRFPVSAFRPSPPSHRASPPTFGGCGPQPAKHLLQSSPIRGLPFPPRPPRPSREPFRLPIAPIFIIQNSKLNITASSLPPPRSPCLRENPPSLCCSKNIFPNPLQSVACLYPPRPPRPLRETFPTPAEPPSRETGPSQPSSSLRHSSSKIKHRGLRPLLISILHFSILL